MNAYQIAVLAEDAQVKKERFYALGVRNTPTDAEERIKARIEYEIARAEMIEAERALTKAIWW